MSLEGRFAAGSVAGMAYEVRTELAAPRALAAVRAATTPGGEAAAVTHYGEYADLAGAYATLERWCAASMR